MIAHYYIYPHQFEAASRGSRLWASSVDLFVTGAPLAVLAVPGEKAATLLGALALFRAVLATQILLLELNGQTIGKRLVGIRMITSRCVVPRPFVVLVFRWLPAAQPALLGAGVTKNAGLGALVLLADAMLMLQPTRRCLHDLLADTHVVKA